MTATARNILERVGINGSSLFWMVSIFTIIYWVIIVVQFIAGDKAASVPRILDELYITALASYVGVNQMEKASNNGERKKRIGQVFFYGWIALTAVGLILVSFHIYGTEKSLNLIWPLPIGPIIGIFGGTQAAKNAKATIQEIRKVFASPPLK